MVSMLDVTIAVAGEAGQGIRLAGEALTRLFARDGYHVFAYPDVMSRIRGGHNLTRIRVSDRSVGCISNQINLLLALDDRSVEEHSGEMVRDGVIVADAAPGRGEKKNETYHDSGGLPRRSAEGEGAAESRDKALVIRIPFTKMAEEIGGRKIYSSAVALGAMIALAGQSLNSLSKLLRSAFEDKGHEVVTANLSCAKAGFEAVGERFRRECPCRLPELGGRPKLLLNGNEAVGYGALCAGVRLYSGYPMSPATGIMEYLAARQDRFNLVMEQAEDEIAAINITLGASWAGVRAMTATSGGGFALMVEGLGLAGMAELPIVIAIAQRPGPATGFPTRHEQAELLYVINAAHDEFPRLVFSPADNESAIYATFRAFELAERFRIPAIVLTDQQLADSYRTVDNIHREKLKTITTDETDRLERSIRPGSTDGLVRTMGSEHDENGFSTEGAANRVKMHSRRLAKADAVAGLFGMVESYPDESVQTLVACFGSTTGAVREAVDKLREERVDVGLLHIAELWPFPSDRVAAKLTGCRRLITVEQNATGQLGRLISRMTRRKPDAEILKYNGRPFSSPELVERIGEVTA